MPAPTTTYEKGNLYQLDLTQLQTDPNQPRKSMDSLFIVAGERRYKAAQQAGLLVLPGICVEGNPAEIALVENMLRQDLTPVEEAEGLQALMTEQKYTQEQLGGIIGKAQNTLSELLSLNKLPQEVRDDCRGDRTISKNGPRHHRQKEAGPGHDDGLHRLQGQTAEGGKPSGRRKTPTNRRPSLT